MPALYHLLYLSSARTAFSHAELGELLDASRRNNDRDRITGLLLYLDGNFIQHIEGEQAAVEGCFGRIEADQRHHVGMVLARGALGDRQFAHWSMGFKQASRCEPADLSLFHLTGKALDERMSGCGYELAQVFMRRFYDCNAGLANLA